MAEGEYYGSWGFSPFLFVPLSDEICSRVGEEGRRGHLFTKPTPAGTRRAISDPEHHRLWT